jgi:hypothetical protein
MKRIETYRWRTLWAGKMTATRYHCSEEDIRKEHPEAVRIEGTLIVREIPETDEERKAAQYSDLTSPPMDRQV